MKHLLILLWGTAGCFSAFAQDHAIQEIQQQTEKKLADDTSHREGWKKGGVFSLGFGQGNSHNWAAGAEKFSFSFSANASAYANLKAGRFSWKNTLDLGYALVNTTSLGTRKTDDKIDLFSKLGYDLSKTISVGGVGNFRTQFYKGFEYDYLGHGLRKRTSGFMAPAYLILAPGFDWHPTDYFSVFLSPIGAKFVFVTNDPKSYYFNNGIIPDTLKTPASGDFEMPLSTLYGVDPVRKVKAEVGGFASVNFFKDLVKNVSFKSRLDLYSNYLRSYSFKAIGPDQLQVDKIPASPQNIDIFWTNLLVMKINKWLQVSYGIDLIYDDDVKQFGPDNDSPGTQYRSQLTIGVSTSF